MNASSHPDAAERFEAANPFSTRRIRPGQLPFHFADDTSLAQLVQRLEDHGGWGEIVGPHGSGKSALLEHLLPRCEASGRTIERFQFRTDDRQLSVRAEQIRSWNHQTLVVVDGFEQLSWWNRWRFKRWCRNRHAGLLVTVHRSVGLPRLYTTSTDAELLRQLVRELVANCHPDWRPSDAEASQAFNTHNGNLREALLQLYDVYQQRQSANSTRPA